eukprot:14744144-Alexandrium_andersonii.AAC.1
MCIRDRPPLAGPVWPSVPGPGAAGRRRAFPPGSSLNLALARVAHCRRWSANRFGRAADSVLERPSGWLTTATS